MKNILLCSALLLSSIHSSVAAASDSTSLRGKPEEDQQDRQLPYYDDYYYGDDDGKGYDDYYYGTYPCTCLSQMSHFFSTAKQPAPRRRQPPPRRYGKAGKRGGIYGKGKAGKRGGGGRYGYGGKAKAGKRGGGFYGGSGKAKAGKRGGGYYDDFYPTIGQINFLDDQYFDDYFFEDDDCELVTLNETFSVPRANLFLAPDTSATTMGTPLLSGTVFIWEDQPIFEEDGDMVIDGTTISGTCTRTTANDEGMGSCQFVFVDDDEYSINVDGLLTGPFGSKLAITGGTGGLVGVIGEMDFFPIFAPGEEEGDVFLNITRYEVEADLGLIVCPEKGKYPH